MKSGSPGNRRVPKASTINTAALERKLVAPEEAGSTASSDVDRDGVLHLLYPDQLPISRANVRTSMSDDARAAMATISRISPSASNANIALLVRLARAQLSETRASAIDNARPGCGRLAEQYQEYDRYFGVERIDELPTRTMIASMLSAYAEMLEDTASHCSSLASDDWHTLHAAMQSLTSFLARAGSGTP